MIISLVNNFLKVEAAGGILLALAAILALIVKNSPLESAYDALLHAQTIIGIGDFKLDKSLQHWINDGLMAIFFLLVGLEIKREIIEGQLSKKENVILPTIAAFGGLSVPAIIYAAINWGNSSAISGWAIPSATDIAFALGVITLLGKRVPNSLKICLVAIAIIDDLVAIIIIALFYTSQVSVPALLLAALALLALLILNKKGITKLSPYIIIGTILWVCVLKSGVHATLAGVALAMFIPLKSKNKAGKSPAKSLEHDLHSPVSFIILPIFAFANAGVSFAGITLQDFTQPVAMGIALGLFFGKQIGVMLLTYIGVATKICKLPEGVNWKQYYAMSLITGIGFTMSLFIGNLAFETDQYLTATRLGVIVGSILSGVTGYFLLKHTTRK